MAAGSASIRPLLAGPRRPAVVVEALSAAVYLQVRTPDEVAGTPDEVVAVVARDAVRVPVAVSVPVASSSRLFGEVRVGEFGWVGDGAVGLPGGRSWRVARWWDAAVPRVTTIPDGVLLGLPLDPHDARHFLDPRERALLDALVAGGRALEWTLPARDTGASRPEVSTHDELGWDDAVAGMVGRGPGLTPEGDDVLAGALVALAALRSPLLPPLAAAVEARLARPGGTTTVSAALLRCATRGLAVPELATFLTTGDRGPLLAVGHTSGAALARGAGLAMLAVLPPPADSTRRTKEAA